MADDPDPNTERELRKARDDAKSYRLELAELKTDLADARKAARDAEKEAGTVKARATELEAALAAATAEAATAKAEVTTKLTQAQKDAEAALQAAKEAHAAELTGLKTQTEQQNIQTEVRLAAVKAGVHSPEDFVKLVDLSKLTRNKETNALEGVDALLEAQKTAKPYLFAVTGTGAGGNKVPDPAPGTGVKNALTMTPEQWAVEKKTLGLRTN